MHDSVSRFLICPSMVWFNPSSSLWSTWREDCNCAFSMTRSSSTWHDMAWSAGWDWFFGSWEWCHPISKVQMGWFWFNHVVRRQDPSTEHGFKHLLNAGMAGKALKAVPCELLLWYSTTITRTKNVDTDRSRNPWWTVKVANDSGRRPKRTYPDTGHLWDLIIILYLWQMSKETLLEQDSSQL